MDIDPLKLIQKVWKHSGLKGHVWVPHIYAIGVKGKQKFREGATLRATKPEIPELRDDVDWYWTPAVSANPSRKAKDFPAQKALWVDCDEGYDDELLTKLRPSYVWETSPGHKQAIWLLDEALPPSEYSKDGFIGLLTHALGADPSGVDIGQLLRVPGTWHHKRGAHQGRVLSASGRVYTYGALLSRVARSLGLSPQLSSELGAADPFGDRSRVLWKFSRNAAEAGLPQDLTYKLMKACRWNKWKDDPEKLKADIERAYARGTEAPAKGKDKTPPPAKEAKVRQHISELADNDAETEEEAEPWEIKTADQFGPVIHKPMRWVVPKIIAEGACGLLVAAPKVGKTRIAIELALGLATGRTPLGLSIRGQMPVGFLSLEDGEYLFSSRMNQAINGDPRRARFHWDGHITKDLHWAPPEPMAMFTNFKPVNLSNPNDLQRLYTMILEYGLKLVIIDTLSMAIGNAEISSSKEMYAILKPIKDIAQETGCSIMFIHHTRKRVFEKGESVQETILGSTALHGWSDYILSLSAPDEENPHLLSLGVQTKMGNVQHHVNKQKLTILKKQADPETTP